MIKVVLLAGANSIHTARWANGLVERGIEVHLVSAHESLHVLDRRIQVYILDIKAPLGYLLAVGEARQIVKDVRPDLINAHYATGYGMLARLVCFKPTLLSAWGSDVYDFPVKSIFHRWLLRGNLKNASAIASTSRCMASKIAEIYSHSAVFITPFGIDVEKFSPVPNSSDVDGKIVIGTVKTLSNVYGIDTLISAFALCWRELSCPDNLYLEISGGGPDLESFEQLAESLSIRDRVIFHGPVQHSLVPEMLNRLDIYVALSRSESFGVAILEAAACEKPVVVSDAEGLAEVTMDGINGFVVPKEDAQAASHAILRLLLNKELRIKMGKAGRQHVINNYSWEISLDLMLDAYAKTVELVKEENQNCHHHRRRPPIH